MVVCQDKAAGADVEQVMDEGAKGHGAGLKCPLAQSGAWIGRPAVECDHEDTLYQLKARSPARSWSTWCASYQDRRWLGR